ncbi:hypothetical protein [Polymorphospora rubra]|uniref:hypothetical protein n=1 Tax=Polymorphospora rubra TaxID=338584 RepID=UPI0033F94981
MSRQLDMPGLPGVGVEHDKLDGFAAQQAATVAVRPPAVSVRGWPATARIATPLRSTSVMIRNGATACLL